MKIGYSNCLSLPRFSGVKLERSTDGKQLKVTIVPNNMFKGVEYNGEVRDSFTAGCISKIGGEEHSSSLEYHTWLAHHPSWVRALLAQVIKDSAMPESEQAESIELLTQILPRSPKLVSADHSTTLTYDMEPPVEPEDPYRYLYRDYRD